MVKSKNTLEKVIEQLRLKNINAIFGRGLMKQLEENRMAARQNSSDNNAATVFVLTYCRDLELFYGTELIFKTLRVGFPNANIVVVDNASLPEARTAIEALAKRNDCLFEQIPAPGVVHHQFIQNTISSVAEIGTAEHPLIFLDPDICLWKNCEGFEFDGLIAGRQISGFHDEIMQTYSMPRLHTSFMWIPSARKLQDAIWKAKARHYDFEPFLSHSSMIGGTWYRYDTGAGLFAVLSGKVSAFTREHLDFYDHLFCGSHIDLLYDFCNPGTKERMREIHTDAKEGNLNALKGIWKHQVLDTRKDKNEAESQRKEVFATNE